MKTPNRPKKANQKDWHPADIVAALHKRGITLRKLAEQHGASPKAVTRALRERSAPGEIRIARALGIAPHIIWPSRYDEDGDRKHLGGRGRPGMVFNSFAVVNGNAGEDA